MNNTFLAGWEEEGELEAVPPLLYPVVGIWANLCICSKLVSTVLNNTSLKGWGEEGELENIPPFL
jgi:hypothetical protein